MLMHRGLLVQVHRQLQDCFNKKEEKDVKAKLVAGKKDD